MSGQYPGPGGYHSPVGGHRGNFSNQMVNMNQIGMQNQMGMMGGYNNQSGMMPQQPQQQSNPTMGGMGGPVLNTTGIQSPSHSQQSTNPQQVLAQQQMHQQQLQQAMPQPTSQPQQQQAQQSTLQTPSTSTASNAMMANAGNPMMAATTSNAMIPAGSMPPHGPLPTMLATAPQVPQKEINIVGLSRLGQETVQDITSRFQEIFSALKTIQPAGNREMNMEKKVQENFRTIRLLFKRVRIIYEKCNDGYPQGSGMEYTHVESLIPYKDEPDHRAESNQCEEYRKALQENRELIETVMLKNKQLREIIDRTRIIVWEINTMLSMRRS